jgi:hypothetical protein
MFKERRVMRATKAGIMIESRSESETSSGSLPLVALKKVATASVISHPFLRALMIVSVLLIGGTEVAAAAVAPSAATELRNVLTAGDSQESVHWMSTGSYESKSLVNSTDAGRSVGIQKITYTSSGSTGHVTVELVGGVLYIRGDAMTLEGYMGLKAARATAIANRWFSMRNNVPDYQAVVAGLTISTTIPELNMSGSITYGPDQKVNGEQTAVLRGKTVANVADTGAPSMPQTLYVASSGKPLPVKVVDDYEGSLSTATFSNWGEAIRVTAPSHAVPFSSTWLQ